MLQFFERILLELVRWLYTLPSFVGLVTLGAAGAVLFIYQFSVRGRAYWPGVLGLILAYASFLHLTQPGKVIDRLTIMIDEIGQGPGVPEIPIMEPLFSILIGDAAGRSVWNELIGVALFTYLAIAIGLGIKDFKTSGKLIGTLSLKLGSRVGRPKRSLTNELGSGDLASAERIAQWMKPKGPGDTCLHVTDVRGSGDTHIDKGKIIFPTGERNRHILAIAKTGSGKTSRLILPILYNDCLDPDRSTIVIDSKPEMWRKLANLTRKHNPNKRILRFNPLDTIQSLSWNILSKIEDETDCKLIANTLIMATDNPSAKSDSPFFRNNALSVLNSIMVGLLHDPKETLSMPRIHELVQSGMRPLCDWLEAHPHAYRTARTFVELARSGSQNADTIMSELGMRLSAWDLPAIRATTAQSELDIEDLISKPTLFIVEFRESELEMLRPMANVIVIELLRFLTKRAESMPNITLPRPVSFVIDEFASALGRLPDIHVKLNTLRSRNVSIVAAIQSIGQIKANYGDDADSVLAGFSTKICMPTLDFQDAEWASKESGQMTVRFQTASKGLNKKLTEVFGSHNDSTQEQVQQRAVLTPDEISRPPDNISTLFLPDTPVFQCHLVPFFKVPEMRSRIEDSERAEPLKLRDQPIEYEESLPSANTVAAAAGAPAAAGGLPPGISNTKGWTDDQVNNKLAEVKKALDWDNTTGSARKWWEAFESENKHRMALVLRLAEELQVRKATITEFFLAYVYSNTDNIQANLHYLDYTRLKKEEERKKREAQQQSGASAYDDPMSSKQVV